jgi:sulfatase maturation enzyme AslB (radical SAM superfamily)
MLDLLDRYNVWRHRFLQISKQDLARLREYVSSYFDLIDTKLAEIDRKLSQRTEFLSDESFPATDLAPSQTDEALPRLESYGDISARFESIDTKLDQIGNKLAQQAERLTPTDLVSPDANEALAKAEFAAGVTTVRSTPPILSLETTSACNLRCVMCAHAYGEVHRPKHLDDALVSELKPFLKRANIVQLHGIGEPTNSPAFWRMLEDLPPPGICKSSINTNFTVIDDERLKKLLDSNLTIINVSLDAGTEATYQKIRGFSFDVVVENIERLLAGRRARGNGFPHVHLNMTLMRSNIEELTDFIRLAERLGVDEIMLWHLNRWPDEAMARYVIRKDGWSFDYAQEGLWNYPALSNRCIRDAVQLAQEAGIPLYLDHNKDIYFDEATA